MRYVFIVNPAAGHKKGGETILDEISAFCAKEDNAELLYTSAAGDATRFARAEAEKGDEVTLFACGGDGTASEVLNGMFGFENARLGIIPRGSGNDFLKCFEKRELFSDLSALLSGNERRVDVIRAADRYCLNVCSLGIDASVAEDMNIFRKWVFVSGKAAYDLAIVKRFFGKIGVRVNIKIDGVDQGESECLFVACANGTTYGGGYICCPSASPFDGLLHWVAIDKISKLRVPAFLKLYSAGKHENLPYVRHGVCREMEITAEKLSPVNIDGEVFRRESIKITLAGSVRFVVPKGVFER